MKKKTKVLYSLIDGDHHRLGRIEAGKPVLAKAGGEPLTDAEKREFGGSEFFELREVDGEDAPAAPETAATAATEAPASA